jgi:hypothetical protein
MARQDGMRMRMRMLVQELSEKTMRRLPEHATA